MFLLLLVYEHLIGVQDRGELSKDEEEAVLLQEGGSFTLRKQLLIGVSR